MSKFFIIVLLSISTFCVQASAIKYTPKLYNCSSDGVMRGVINFTKKVLNSDLAYSELNHFSSFQEFQLEEMEILFISDFYTSQNTSLIYQKRGDEKSYIINGKRNKVFFIKIQDNILKKIYISSKIKEEQDIELTLQDLDNTKYITSTVEDVMSLKNNMTGSIYLILPNTSSQVVTWEVYEINENDKMERCSIRFDQE